MNKTWLITGGAGNLACQLTFLLAAQGVEVVLCDVVDGPSSAVAPGCRYVRGDLTRPGGMGDLLADCRPHTILHFASLLSGNSEKDRALAWKVNMDGSFSLFEEAVRHGVSRLFFPSSAAAYGGALPCPLPEDYPQWPVGLYGVTKASIERLGVYYHQRFGLDFRCLRLPVVVSSHAPAGASSAYASRVFVEAVHQGRFVFRVRPGTRPSLIYVKDVLSAMLRLLSVPSERLSRRVYNIQALAPTALQIADAVRRRIPSADLTFDPQPEIADLIESWPVELVDASARRDWDWRPSFGLEALADDFVAQIRAGA